MSLAASDICKVRRVEIAVEPWQWDFANSRRADIDRHFSARRSRQPALWNGSVLLLNRYAVADGVLRGGCFETDYASFLAWRDWGFPGAPVFNIFAAAALRAADGTYLAGEMAQTTAAAGQIYFPCGTPDPEDLTADGALDLDGSLGRELREETGLDIAALDAEPDWLMVRDGSFLAIIKRLTAGEDARQLRERILRHLGSQTQPEFSGIRILRGRADFNSQMPRFVVSYLEHVWRQ